MTNLIGKEVVVVGYEGNGIGTVTGIQLGEKPVVVQFDKDWLKYQNRDVLATVEDQLISLDDEEAMIGVLTEHYNILSSDIPLIIEKFELESVRVLFEVHMKGDLKMSTDYSSLLRWVYEDNDKDSLLDMIVNGEPFVVDSEQYIELPDETCIFMYI